MRTVWVRLPAELKHMILCELVRQLEQDHHNRESRQKMSQLSLSSRAWCRIFRPLLFNELLIWSSYAGPPLCPQLRMLHSILNSSASKGLTDHIHTVKISSRHKLPSTTEVHEPILAALLGIIRGLHQLSLSSYATEGMLIDQPLLLSWRQRTRSLQHLRSLRMTHCYFPSFSGLIRFLAALPSLQHVVFHRPRWGEHSGWQPPQWRPHICNSGFHQIKSITLCYAQSPSATLIPSWIFATASTHFQHSRRQQSRGGLPSDPTPTPPSEIVQFAALFEKALTAGAAPSVWKCRWEKEHSGEGADTKFACNSIRANWLHCRLVHISLGLRTQPFPRHIPP